MIDFKYIIFGKSSNENITWDTDASRLIIPSKNINNELASSMNARNVTDDSLPVIDLGCSIEVESYQEILDVVQNCGVIQEVVSDPFARLEYQTLVGDFSLIPIIIKDHKITHIKLSQNFIGTESDPVFSLDKASEGVSRLINIVISPDQVVSISEQVHDNMLNPHPTEEVILTRDDLFKISSKDIVSDSIELKSSVKLGDLVKPHEDLDFGNPTQIRVDIQPLIQSDMRMYIIHVSYLGITKHYWLYTVKELDLEADQIFSYKLEIMDINTAIDKGASCQVVSYQNDLYLMLFKPTKEDRGIVPYQHHTVYWGEKAPNNLLQVDYFKHSFGANFQELTKYDPNKIFIKL